MANSNVLVYSFPLRKKIFILFCSLYILGLSYVAFISGSYLLMILGSLLLIMVIFSVYKTLITSTVLTVTQEGLIPHSVMKYGSEYVIPWNNIQNIYVAQQRGRNISETYLAMQLFNAELLDQQQNPMQNVVDTLNTTISDQMSDKSGGDIYVSVKMLNKSAKTIIEEIELFCSQHNIVPNPVNN